MVDRRRTVTALALALVASVAIVGPLALGTPATAGSETSSKPVAIDESGPTAPRTIAPIGEGDKTSTPATDAECPIEGHREAGAGSTSTATTDARIVELYPNPTARGDVGEHLVLETPPGTRLANWTITDGHTTATLPNETVSGRVAASTDPAATDALTDAPVLELDGTLRLADDGDALTLRNGTGVVDEVAYDRAPLAERWYRAEPGGEADSRAADTAIADGGGQPRGQWWPRDATCRPVSTFDPDDATAFVLPDAPAVPLETIREADDRLLLAGYTFTDPDIAAALANAAARGVDVAVLLESGPVGGAPSETRSRIETLRTAGVEVRAVGGEGARYRYHHPKYLVADDAVLVTTENWKPSGVGGASSRGWGVRLTDAALAADLASVFRTDFRGWDTESGAAYLANASFVADDPPPPRSFEADHEPATVPIESAELLLVPDNAESRLESLVASAEDELLVQQATVDPDVSLLEATIAAARRGVTVRLLLDSSWYVEDDHERLAADLERTAARDDLDFEVRLADDTDAFEKIHTKGLVVDRETAVVGSANWNDNSLRENREVLLAVHGEEIATYYATVFEDDWAGETWSLPIELSAVVVAALVGAAIVGRRYVRFGDAGSVASRDRN
ncbi:phospholipase D-like domain-containing protein [Halosolutus amylolyticus]|uniref:Phospholipase D-like domain-containing protein n=1 Tax=Halosolutus amylolyticus TaxID=2932267 RepID=A0ABD5PUX7_9EURY|nr:phospholipase D-like domain-containing protein [Halosolutus amylolyticus]